MKISYLVWLLFLDSVVGLLLLPYNNSSELSLNLVVTPFLDDADLLGSTPPITQNEETTEDYPTTTVEEGSEDSRESVNLSNDKLNVVPDILLHKIKWRTRTK